MGYIKLENVLLHDHLPEGTDPSYTFNRGDTWYLGLAGELACETMCDKLTLPMLSHNDFNWEESLKRALVEASSLRPQHTVENFKEAFWHFSTQISPDNEFGSWFGGEDVVNTLKSKVKFNSSGKYLNNLHYNIDRNGLSFDMNKGLKGLAFSSKTVILVPDDDFGVLSKNDKYFNFLLQPDKIFRYHLKNVEIGDDA